jgi:hypothetical protein
LLDAQAQQGVASAAISVSSRRLKKKRDDLLDLNQRRKVPYEFVLDELSALSPFVKPMFGCLAVYVGPKIVLALRDKPEYARDNGVWIATTSEHHESLRNDFPNLRSIELFGTPVTSWQVLPADSPDFEESAVHVCELIRARDQRIGNIPKPRRRRKK